MNSLMNMKYEELLLFLVPREGQLFGHAGFGLVCLMEVLMDS